MKAALRNEREHEQAVTVIDRLMARPKLTKGQELYLETMVQLVQAYEAEHHAIEVSDLSGIETLRHLLEENEMNASDLARLLGVHPSMGSKILKGERSLTVEHLRKLSDRFKVNAALFID
jgi:HTH-type transcriptional regulator / antitoxin HigA